MNHNLPSSKSSSTSSCSTGTGSTKRKIRSLLSLPTYTQYAHVIFHSSLILGKFGLCRITQQRYFINQTTKIDILHIHVMHDELLYSYVVCTWNMAQMKLDALEPRWRRSLLHGAIPTNRTYSPQIDTCRMWHFIWYGSDMLISHLRLLTHGRFWWNMTTQQRHSGLHRAHHAGRVQWIVINLIMCMYDRVAWHSGTVPARLYYNANRMQKSNIVHHVITWACLLAIQLRVWQWQWQPISRLNEHMSSWTRAFRTFLRDISANINSG